METVREIVSTGLRERDRAQIGIRWPLAETTVKSKIKPSNELIEVIKEELNVKKLTHKKAEQLEVSLDTKITPELEAEGFARETARKVQAARKTAGLIKTDSIELELQSEFNDKLKSQTKFIQERVGAKIMSLDKSTKKFSHSEEGKIKGKAFSIRFNKI
jgi:isoleucyl-tRNA synthetase